MVQSIISELEHDSHLSRAVKKGKYLQSIERLSLDMQVYYPPWQLTAHAQYPYRGMLC